MAKAVEQVELTQDQVWEHLIKNPHVREMHESLDLVVAGDTKLGGAYIHIHDREGSSWVKSKGDVIISKIEVHLDYHLDLFNRKLMEGIFGTESDPEIRVFYTTKEHQSTYAKGEIRNLSDVDKIIDLAKRYRTIIRSPSYESIKGTLSKISDDITERMASLLLQNKTF